MPKVTTYCAACTAAIDSWRDQSIFPRICVSCAQVAVAAHLDFCVVCHGALPEGHLQSACPTCVDDLVLERFPD